LSSDDRLEKFLENMDKPKKENEFIKPDNKLNGMHSAEQSLLALFNTGQYTVESMKAAIKLGTSPNVNNNGVNHVGDVNNSETKHVKATSMVGETNERNEIGLIKLYRKILENGKLRNHKLWTFLTYCFFKASHKKRISKIGRQFVELQPGEFIFGRKKASEETKLSIQEIRTCLKKSKKAGNLTIKSTNKFSVVTILNWGDLSG